MASTTIKPNESATLKLSPAAFLPSASFTFHNDTDVALQVSAEKKEIRISKVAEAAPPPPEATSPETPSAEATEKTAETTEETTE